MEINHKKTTDIKIHILSGNIHLPHSNYNETKMSTYFDKYSTTYAITRETGDNNNEHYHFYIESRITQKTLRDYLIKHYPEIKQPHIKNEPLNKDGTKKGWERRISIKKIKPSKNSILNFDQEYQLIQYYIYKDVEPDVWKPISKNITIEEILEMKQQYYNLVKLYHDTKNTLNKSNKKEYLTITQKLQKSLKDKTSYMGADGETRHHKPNLDQIQDVVLDYYEQSNKTITYQQIENSIFTLCLKNNLNKNFRENIKELNKQNFQNKNLII